MAKRTQGQQPYQSEHPNRPWMPDVPGHSTLRGRGVVVRRETKELLEKTN